MATIQSTDFRVTIEPTIVTPEFDFGPSDSVPANAVLLTSEYLRTLGSYPPRSAFDWDCNLWVYQTVSGVETAVDLTDMTISGVYWDPIARVANALTVAKPVGTAGQLVVSFAAADAPTAGMYKFHIRATETEVFDLCEGWIEILRAIPS